MKVGELFVRMAMDTSQFDKDERTAKSRVTTLGDALSSTLKGAFSFALGMGFFQAIKAGFKATVGAALDFNSTMEQAKLGFTTMLKSADKAQAFLESLSAFAAKTPFAFEDLLTASQRMMALGFQSQEIIPTLTAIGDAMAAMGRGTDGIDAVILALGQMRMAGRVNAQDMLQLTNAGIPAWELLAEAMGKTVAETRQLAQSGRIEGKWAASVMLEGMEKRFPGMMKKMENSWKGVTSTIKDIWRMTVGALTQDLFAGATNWLKRIRDTATSFYDLFSQLRKNGVDSLTALRVALTKVFGPDVAALVSSFISAVKNVWRVAAWAATMIKQRWAEIKPIVLAAISAFLVFRVAIPVIAAVQKWLLLVDASLAAVNPLAVAAAAALTAAFLAWSKYAQSVEKANMDKVMAAFGQAMGDYADSADDGTKATDGLNDALAAAGKTASKNLQSFDEVHQLMDDMASSAQGASGKLDDTLGLDNTSGLGDLLTLPEFEAPTLQGFWDSIVSGLKAKLGEVKFTLSSWLDDAAFLIGAKGLWDQMQPPLPPPPAVSPITIAIDAVNARLQALKESLPAWGLAASQAIQSWALSAGGAISNWAINTQTTLSNWVANASNSVSTWATNARTAISNWASNTSIEISTWVTNTATGLATWAAGAGSSIATWATNAATNISNWAVNTKGVINTWAATSLANLISWAQNGAAQIGDFASVGYDSLYNWGKNSLTAVNTFLDASASNIADWANNAIRNISDMAKSAYGSLRDLASSFGVKLADSASFAVQTVKNGFKAAAEWVSNNKDWLIPAGVTAGAAAAILASGGLAGLAALLTGGAAAAVPGFASGGVVTSPTLAMVGEAGPEAIIPLSTIKAFNEVMRGLLNNLSQVRMAADNVAASLVSMATIPAATIPVPAPAFANANLGAGTRGYAPSSMPQPEIHLHIGTLVADDYGLKKLERSLRKFRLEEDQRIGDAQ